MTTRILVSVDRFETRVAITEGDRVSECHIERRGRRSVVGHVWKGRVENVLAGIAPHGLANPEVIKTIAAMRSSDPGRWQGVADFSTALRL